MSLPNRILENRHVNKNRCWIWLGAKSNNYGQVWFNNKTQYIHILSYEIYKGEIEGIVRHKCDNKLCFNPEHLELGTYSDNIRDSITRNKRKTNKEFEFISPPHHSSIEERINWYLNTASIINNCIIPNKVPLESGYIKIKFKTKQYILSRLICSIEYKKDYVDSTWVARHTCHNKQCCNPKHLIAGTESQNRIDSRDASNNSILTKEIVIKIKQDMEKIDFKIKGSKMEFDQKWANKLNVSKMCITHIRLGNRWKDV
jgi:hypothetical protein